MKFSDDTLAILKNFSRINQSIMFKPGQKIRTISPQKTVMAEAVVSETFDTSAGVYDISRFIGTLTLFDAPDVSFQDGYFQISSDKSNLKYTYTSEEMIVVPPEKDISVPTVEVSLDLNSTVLESVTKAADVLGLPEICFSAKNGNFYIKATDSKNPTADNYSTILSENVECEDFDMYIQKDYLRLVPNEYTVSISKNGMAHFKSDKVQYWVAGDSK